MSDTVSRRNFLRKSALVAGGVAAVAGVEAVTPLVLGEKLEFDANESLWAAARPPVNPPLAGDLDVDVAVIGGGYTGLSAAYYIRRRFPDRKVAVFEARETGHGASGRNGGMVLPQPANEYMEIGSDPETHRRTYEVTVKNIDDVLELVRAQGMDCDFKRSGVLKVFVKEAHAARGREYPDRVKKLGIPVEYWDKARVKKEIGTDVYHGGLYDPNGGDLHPMKLVRALKKAAERAGAAVYDMSPVSGIEEGETIRLTVGEGRHRVRARAVVLATNGYTSKLGYFKNSVLAIHTPMALTRPLPEKTFRAIGWRKRAAFSDSYNVLYHLSCTADNRILIGSGLVEYYFNNGTKFLGDRNRMEAHLARELARIFPGLSGVPFEYLWSGVLGFSLDFSQSVGVTGKNKNIYYGLAYAGHGVNLATLFGKTIADLYAGEGDKWKGMPFLNNTFIPLPPEPLKWLGVQANIAYYRMLDSWG